MREFKIKKGRSLSRTGEPVQEVTEGQAVSRVALLGPDYAGAEPVLAVETGQGVKTGTLLFTDAKNPGVRFTSPGCGTVEEINRGEDGRLLAVVIRLSENDEVEEFIKYDKNDLKVLSRQAVVENLTASGLWPALREHPDGTIPPPESTADALFITAMDTDPLAPSAEVVISMYREAFIAGLKVLTRLEIPKIFLCRSPKEVTIPGEQCVPELETVVFSGPHPAGLPETHIPLLSQDRPAWHVGYQDVIAVGKLFLTGKLDVTRVVSLAGPRVKEPRLVRTRLGASLAELVAEELAEQGGRVISGSVISGHEAAGAMAYLGRYHRQVTVLKEGGKQIWQPGT